MATSPTNADVFAEEAATRLGEPVLAAQNFYPADRWMAPLGLGRLARRLLGNSRLDDHLGQWNLLIVTASRVAVFGVNFSHRRGVTLSGPHGAWPRTGVSATKKRVELSRSTAVGGDYMGQDKTRFLRVMLQTPDGELGADMSIGERHTHQIARALAAT